jgi:hypothetical protein
VLETAQANRPDAGVTVKTVEVREVVILSEALWATSGYIPARSHTEASRHQEVWLT